MAAKTNRSCAGDAAPKPNNPFEGARPGPFRPSGEAEQADIEQKRSRSQLPLSSAFEPAELDLVKPKESLKFRTGTVETNKPASSEKSRQSICLCRTVLV